MSHPNALQVVLQIKYEPLFYNWGVNNRIREENADIFLCYFPQKYIMVITQTETSKEINERYINQCISSIVKNYFLLNKVILMTKMIRSKNDAVKVNESCNCV